MQHPEVNFEKLDVLEERTREHLDNFMKLVRIQVTIDRIIGIILMSLGVIISVFGLLHLLINARSSIEISLNLIILMIGLIFISFGRLWKGSPEKLEKIISNQALLKVSYIGFINRTNQIRSYWCQIIQDEVRLESFEKNQQMLKEAIDQACRHLSDHPLD
ncbi:hypothetical protein LARV_01250 [Longilinea arvoryzae]|uniref:Uncharacterized protein n=2 Tax=Longilinea arvoryzae TaxID=360412 RepID=A0A0S7BH34_9CHLR|nr:hypothetical protein LARV_01250 [Longilinea arvoryzae]